MRQSQKMIFMVYLSCTALIVCLDIYYPHERNISYLKYAIVITMLLIVLFRLKRNKERQLIIIAFFFMVIGDFFLVLTTTFVEADNNYNIIGAWFFLFSYICLILIYRRGYLVKKNKIEIMVGIILGFIFTINIITAPIEISFGQLMGMLLFGVVISTMVWFAVCASISGCFCSRAGKIIIASAILMYICDMSIAYAFLRPLEESHQSIVKTVTWASYIPGWSLLIMVAYEQKIHNVNPISLNSHPPCNDFDLV